jgi:outer membrane protein OmpA-like peptidoglycan-associated protein
MIKTMKKKVLWTLFAVFAIMFFSGLKANAQSVVVVQEAELLEVPCKNYYYTTPHSNWFMQFGAGANTPFLENHLDKGKKKHHQTVVYNLAFGKWFTPYVAWRMSFLGGPIHWDNNVYSKAKYVNANFDVMWNMFNSLGGVKNHVFAIVPFVGLGGTFAWDFKPNEGNIVNDHGKLRRNSWTLPVSAGLQMRFRLCSYADFFIEGRAQMYGDNFNNYAYGDPVDVNITAIGGFTINFGGSGFKGLNPCDYLSYVGTLNNQVNELREALAGTAAALAVAESQLPCPEVPQAEAVVIEDVPPLMSTVRFTINSAAISDAEMVNIYNVAQWMDANPDQSVAIIGFADKATGTSAYNKQLSRQRAQNVFNALTNQYSIDPDRLSIQAEGSDIQPYEVNNWNRIVIFEISE